MDFVIVDDVREKTGTLSKTCLQPQKNYDSSEMWRHATAYLIEDAGNEAETGTKRQNMSIRKPGRQVWCMKINVCSKQINLIFFKKKKNTHFNFRQQSEFFFFPSLLYYPSVSIIITWLCFIIPLYHASTFHIVALSLSLPISLCSFFKCLSLSALSPSLSLCVFLPPPQEQNLW